MDGRINLTDGAPLYFMGNELTNNSLAQDGLPVKQEAVDDKYVLPNLSTPMMPMSTVRPSMMYLKSPVETLCVDPPEEVTKYHMDTSAGVPLALCQTMSPLEFVADFMWMLNHVRLPNVAANPENWQHYLEELKIQDDCEDQASAAALEFLQKPVNQRRMQLYIVLKKVFDDPRLGSAKITPMHFNPKIQTSAMNDIMFLSVMSSYRCDWCFLYQAAEVRLTQLSKMHSSTQNTQSAMQIAHSSWLAQQITQQQQQTMKSLQRQRDCQCTQLITWVKSHRRIVVDDESFLIVCGKTNGAETEHLIPERFVTKVNGVPVTSFIL